MKKLVVFSLAVCSLGSIYAADPQAPATPPPPLPPLDQANRPNHGPRPEGDRKDWKNRPGMKWGHDGKGPGPQGGRGFGGPRGDGPQKAGGQGGMLAEALNLTPEQKQKAKAIMEDLKPKIEAIRQEGREKIRSVIADAGKELRPLLTPEQQAVFDDLQKLRADKAALDAAQKPKPSPAAKEE